MSAVTSRRTKAEAVFADCMGCGKRIVGDDGAATRRRARAHAKKTGHDVHVTVEHTLIYETKERS